MRGRPLTERWQRPLIKTAHGRFSRVRRPSHFMRTILAFVLLCVALVVVVEARSMPQAEAYQLEQCHQLYPEETIWNQNSAGYATNTNWAAVYWILSPTPIGEIIQNSSGSDIYTTDGNSGNVGWSGLTTYNCTGAAMDVGAHVQYNTIYTNNYSDGERQSVMAHELGHTLGLDHSSATTCPDPLMYPNDARWGDCNYNVNRPQSDDIAGTNATYLTAGGYNYGNLAQNVEWGVNPSPNSNCNVHFQFGTFLGTAYAKIKINSGNCTNVKAFVNDAIPAFGHVSGTWYQAQVANETYFEAAFTVYMVPNPGQGVLLYGLNFCVGC